MGAVRAAPCLLVPYSTLAAPHNCTTAAAAVRARSTPTPQAQEYAQGISTSYNLELGGPRPYANAPDIHFTATAQQHRYNQLSHARETGLRQLH